MSNFKSSQGLIDFWNHLNKIMEFWDQSRDNLHILNRRNITKLGGYYKNEIMTLNMKFNKI